MDRPTKRDIQDLYFMEVRAKLLDVAAYLDRVDRHTGDPDFRHSALLGSFPLLEAPHPGKTRTQSILEHFSDHTDSPAPSASMQGATGAVPISAS